MTTPTAPSPTALADKLAMQNRLFSELSRMFGREVPLYDKSLLVNSVCNRAVCTQLGRMFKGFSLSDEQIEATSGERHGAIRIGRPDEYRWVARFFGCFAMEPHNFYDMTNVGAKSQPIIATAFRSRLHPEHRVFTSLLMTDYFDPATRARIDGVLAGREVFSSRAKELIGQSEKDGGLDWTSANELIREGTERIFKWTGRARDHGLYKDLCAAGFKIAADIACFERHHLNHLTPNTFCMDLYTAAMKHCMGEMDGATFGTRATAALKRLNARADHDFLELCFKHLNRSEISTFQRVPLAAETIPHLVEGLLKRLGEDDLVLSGLSHAGFKQYTEGPSEDTPVFLRQDAYKALTEPVVFANEDGSTIASSHTARFGEIEQRFYACTPKGRTLYDACLNASEADAGANAALAASDFEAYEARYAGHFRPFPKSLPELLEAGLVFGVFASTEKGRTAAGTLSITAPMDLVRSGYATYEGLRYEDFLPVSAAGIFASNLNQYGTKSTAAAKPTYSQSMLEAIMGKPIIDADAAYDAISSASLLRLYADLKLLDRLPAAERAALQSRAALAPA